METLQALLKKDGLQLYEPEAGRQPSAKARSWQASLSQRSFRFEAESGKWPKHERGNLFLRAAFWTEYLHIGFNKCLQYKGPQQYQQQTWGGYKTFQSFCVRALALGLPVVPELKFNVADAGAPYVEAAKTLMQMEPSRLRVQFLPEDTVKYQVWRGEDLVMSQMFEVECWMDSMGWM